MSKTDERLQKILARAGYGSRRACEELIAAGRVRVNDVVADLGAKADPQKDKITVDGRLLKLEEAPVYIALYKPRHVLSAARAQDRRRTVIDLVDISQRVFPVGRLDVDSEGLILLTNDGELANRLAHPRYGHEKEYRVLVARRPDDEQLEAWRHGVVLEDGYRTAPAAVWVESFFGKGAWLRTIMREGRKRQIREIGKRLGLPVVRIIRVRIGSLQLGRLKPGEWRYLTEAEVAALKGNKETSTIKSPTSRPWTARRRSPGVRSRKPVSRAKTLGELSGSTKRGESGYRRHLSEKSKRK